MPCCACRGGPGLAPEGPWLEWILAAGARGGAVPDCAGWQAAEALAASSGALARRHYASVMSTSLGVISLNMNSDWYSCRNCAERLTSTKRV